MSAGCYVDLLLDSVLISNLFPPKEHLSRINPLWGQLPNPYDIAKFSISFCERIGLA